MRLAFVPSLRKYCPDFPEALVKLLIAPWKVVAFVPPKDSGTFLLKDNFILESVFTPVTSPSVSML